MKLSKYGMFIEIYESGSFTNAADKFNYTTSAISQLIQSLENDLNVQLLYRSKSGLTLTTEGERLLPFFKDIYDAEMRMEDEVFNTNHTVKGAVRIGAIASVASYLLPAVLKEFSDKYPSVDYQIIGGSYRDITDMILSGKVDIGFIKGSVPFQLDVVPLPLENMVITAPPSHKIALHDHCSIQMLDNEPMLLLDDGYPEEIYAYFRKNQVHPNFFLKVKGNLSILNMIKEGLGISILPEMLVKAFSPTLICRPLDPPLFRSIAIACKDKQKLSLVNRIFLKSLIHHASSSMPEI